mmetsp:Transcript_25913/g.42352  ORF Transcript_25913/g.42352 Transcript_25913/m.42352 type:complete len:146 (+) Transcript_25913:1320-1757(+)
MSIILSCLLLFVPMSMAVVDICMLPPVVGPCRAHIPRYFYNPATGQCEQFFYGGCMGNENNFQTVAKCESECLDNTDVVGCGIDHCIGYFNGCNNCFCSLQADGSYLAGCTMMYCPPDAYTTPECKECEEPYILDPDTKKCKLPA